MTPHYRSRRLVRTMFGELLRERRQTAEEFSEEATRVARENGVNATLSPRHVQRLAAGRHSDGRPLGQLRPATQRLLELMFDRPIEELLGQPSYCPPSHSGESDDADELRAAIAQSQRVDAWLVRLFQHQLDAVRQIDRRLGAHEVLHQLREQIEHMTARLTYSLKPDIKSSLAAVLVDACTLAGWQSLDQGQFVQAWQHYEQARACAHESNSAALLAYATAAQAVMLLDVDRTAEAAQLMESTQVIRSNLPNSLRAWLDGAAGEVHAANGRSEDSKRSFDSAFRALELGTDESGLPFVLLNSAHLARWQGGALARLGSRSAVRVLERALSELDPTFARAAVSLRLDLAQSLVDHGDREAAIGHLDQARTLVIQTGSVRLNRRGDRIVSGLAHS